MAQATVATWIVLDSKEEETEFPSAGLQSSSKEFQFIYWRCALVFFASSVRQNPAAHHALFSNVDIASHAPAEVLERLRSWNVELITLPITRRMPAGMVQAFGNAFYELDIVQYAQGRDWQGMILLDLDCVWVGPSAEIEHLLDEQSIVTYTLKPEDQKDCESDGLINGMSRKEMRRIIEAELGPMDRAPRISGGEFLALTAEGCQLLTRYFDAMWKHALDHVHLEDSMKNEEQFFSILYEFNRVQPNSANRFIRRLWTNFEDFNLKESDLMLTIWHLPAEKRYGYRTLYRELLNSKSRFWTGRPEEAVEVIRQHMGVPRKGPVKFGRDVFQKINERVNPSVRAKQRRATRVGTSQANLLKSLGSSQVEHQETRDEAQVR